MLASTLLSLAVALLAPAAPPIGATQDQIASAESAGPASIAAQSTIRDWAGNTLREGDNGWTCLPDRPDTDGNDPWCVDAAWLEFLDAYVNQREPQYTTVGFAYMLGGDAAVSNTDPYATAPTDANEWVTGVEAHLMMLIPDDSLLASIPTNHRNGGPWVMWGGTPYAHIMIPIDSYDGGGH